MGRNVIETVMGGVVLLVAAAFLVFAFRSSGIATASGGYRVVAPFDDASGISPGSDVRLAGVKIGRVVSQALDPQTFVAQVTVEIDQGIELPKDTSARIIPDGLLGGSYVSLAPGGDDANLEDGDRIQFTQGAINVVDLLGRFVFGAAEEASSDGGQ